MIIIYKELIKKNINNLTINHVKDFADKNNISYTDDELNTIYHFIMYYYQDLLDENIKVFDIIKNKINPNLYKKLLNLYVEYKEKYL